VSACRHVPLAGLACCDIHNVVEEVCFAMLAAEISTYDVLMVREMRLAVLASVDLVAVQVDIVGKTHGLELRADCADLVVVSCPDVL